MLGNLSGSVISRFTIMNLPFVPPRTAMQTSEHFHAQRWMKPIYSGNNIWLSLRLVLELWWCIQIEWKVYLHLFFHLCKSDHWTVLISHKLPRDVTVEAYSRSRLHRDLSWCETAQAVLRITSTPADSIVYSWKEAHKDSGLGVKHFQLTQTLNLWHLHEHATSQVTLYAIALPPKLHFTFSLILSKILCYCICIDSVYWKLFQYSFSAISIHPHIYYYFFKSEEKHVHSFCFCNLKIVCLHCCVNSSQWCRISIFFKVWYQNEKFQYCDKPITVQTHLQDPSICFHWCVMRMIASQGCQQIHTLQVLLIAVPVWQRCAFNHSWSLFLSKGLWALASQLYLWY